MQQKKGNENILNEQQQAMRTQVVDLELKARYWKAMHDIRYYTLQSDELEDRYEAFLKEQQAIEEKRRSEFIEQLEELKKKGAAVEEQENA